MPVEDGCIAFAVIGDVEPKPKPDFGNLNATINAINALKEKKRLQFTASIGDLAHTGKTEHFDAITDILSELTTPFYAIMGNEELMAGEDVFFTYASRWNDDPNALTQTRYVINKAGFTFIFATAVSGGVTFDQSEIDWMLAQVNQHADRPIILITHAPAPNIFPESKGRWMKDDLIESVLQHPSVIMHFSGHTHFDLDAVEGYVEDKYGVHHVHIPGIERTKVGRVHTPRFRVVEIDGAGEAVIRTYNVLSGKFEEKHEIRFSISQRKEATNKL